MTLCPNVYELERRHGVRWCELADLEPRVQHLLWRARAAGARCRSWSDVERLHDEVGLAPQIPLTASRVSVPVFQDGAQVGRASSTTWSPTLKKMIALATVERDAAQPGTPLQMELTVDHRRREAGAVVTKLPFFDPPRKRA